MNRMVQKLLLVVALGAVSASGTRADLESASPSVLESNLIAAAEMTHMAPAHAGALRLGGLRGGQPDAVGRTPLHIRLGMMLAPNVRFAGGLDYAVFPAIVPIRLRVDAEVILDADIGGGATLFPLTLNAVTRGGILYDILEGPAVYVGAGIGSYLGHKTRFGGKVFLGLDFQDIAGIEASAHFPGSGDVLFALQLRLGL